MIIKREICGKEVSIKLSSHELFMAFEEQQHIFDKYDCEDMIVGLPDEEVYNTYHVSKKQFENLLDEMAVEKRRFMDEYDMSWNYARDEAIRHVLSRHCNVCSDCDTDVCEVEA